jgi:O-antigen/teichoic acid export membrane protein
MGGATVSLRVLSFFAAVILARLLDPSDFGLVGLAYVVLSTTNLFAGLGMGPAVIQLPVDRDQAAYQGFVVTVAVGLLLFLVIEGLAAQFASALGNPQVVNLLRWMAILIPLGSVSIIPEALLHKELRFGVISSNVMIGEITYSGVAIGLALTGHGVWSLVCAALTKQVVYTSLVWLRLHDRQWIRPRLWDSPLMNRLFRFGWQSAGSGLIVFFYQTIDNLTVGRQLGATALGYYGKSYDFSVRTVFGLSAVLGSVLFPSYSRIQSDPQRLSRAYIKSLRVVSLFTVPMSIGFFLLAQDAVGVLLGVKWLPMVPAFQVLSFVGLVMPISSSAAAVFSSTGRPGFNLRGGLVVVLVMVPLIFLLLPMGIAGVAIAVLSAHVAGYLFNMYQVHLVLDNTASKMLPAVVPALLGAVAMAGAVLLVKPLVVGMTGDRMTVLSLLLLIATGASVYGTTLLLIQRPLLLELLGMLRQRDVTKAQVVG